MKILKTFNFFIISDARNIRNKNTLLAIQKVRLELAKLLFKYLGTI